MTIVVTIAVSRTMPPNTASEMMAPATWKKHVWLHFGLAFWVEAATWCLTQFWISMFNYVGWTLQHDHWDNFGLVCSIFFFFFFFFWGDILGVQLYWIDVATCCLLQKDPTFYLIIWFVKNFMSKKYQWKNHELSS